MISYPLMGEVNNSMLLQWQPSRGGVYKAASIQSVFEVDVLEAGKLAKRKDLSDWVTRQIVMARWLDKQFHFAEAPSYNLQDYSKICC